MMAGAAGTDCELWPPWGAEALVSFWVPGQPRPAGSKDTGIVTRFDAALGKRVPVLNPASGMPKTFTRDTTGAGGKNWRADVRQAAADALAQAHELADGPLAVRITFFIARPKSHYGTGRNAHVLKATAARFPSQSKLADGDKLSRSVHDALTKLVWTDDSRVVHCWWSRAYGPDGAQVDIFVLPETAAPVATASLLDSAGSSGYHAVHGDDAREALAG